ncbi:hypothetical protein MMC25_006688 [Agyrium rufum]|nr:hypothetical protein [Agyrium rufum]
MLLTRQIAVLTWKNILIALLRHPASTFWRAFFAPIVFAWFLSYARNLFIPPSHFGVGSALPIRSLQDAFSASGGGRHILALVNNGFTGGDIEKVIDKIRATGGTIDYEVLTREEDLLITCRNSLKGASPCIAGVVFMSSPTEGPGGIWNYTLRADGALGEKIVVTSSNNDPEIYVLPVQHAVDSAIVSLNSTIDQTVLQQPIYEYPFTSETQQERDDNIRIRYMSGIIDILAVAFLIAIIGITYQLTGMMASERESSMSQLIECMMPNKRRWEPQLARLTSYHLAFSAIYIPGWIIIGAILAKNVFSKTNIGVVIILHLLAGWALASFSIFGAAFFRRAQLSGILVTIASILLAVLGQVINKNLSTGVVYILSLLFPSMNFTFFIIVMARWEAQNVPTDLTKAAPENPWTVPGIVLWIFLILQIFLYPILGAYVERILWGTSTGQRHLSSTDDAAVELNGFTKVYRQNWFASTLWHRLGGKKKDDVVAVNNLSLKVLPGQIMVLLGANGSGKSTTLDALAGLTSITSGSISLDGSHGLGYCPQRNVLFRECTVLENVQIFNKLKSIERLSTKDELRQLIKACDLDRKIGAKVSSLSGGQMRKLQLSMMFVGDSRVCLVDECSSGVDAIARRKLQDILLAERSRTNRTIIFTTHFLDEADLLSDNICILSKGNLKINGTAPEIKSSMGLYRIHVFINPGDPPAPDFANVARYDMVDQTQYHVPDAASASELLMELDQGGFKYQISGPTIEDAFLKTAEEMAPHAEKSPTSIPGSQVRDDVSDGKGSEVVATEKDLQLKTGTHVNPFRQGLILFRKRATIFRRNILPNLAAFLIPIVAAGLASIYLRGFAGAGCSPSAQSSISDIDSLLSQYNYSLIIGPTSKFTKQDLARIASTLPGGSSAPSAETQMNMTNILMSSIIPVDTLDQFNAYINQNYANVTPGGFFLGDDGSPPTLAWKGDGSSVSLASTTLNLLDTVLTNISISSQYQSFDIPWQANQGSTLQFSVYFGLALSIYPAFFALYPCIERLRNVRSLHYSNSVRALPLWMAYIAWDFSFVLASSVIAVVILQAMTSAWYNLGYLFVVLFLYGLTGTLFSYVISLFSKSQLAAFAIAAGVLAGEFLLYIIAYLSVLTYAPVNKVDNYLLIVHFTIAAVFPTGNLIRAIFVSLNIFSIICKDRSVAPYPGAISVYGGPILYLVMQSLFLFCFLIWWDSKSSFGSIFRRKSKHTDSEAVDTIDDELAAELNRVLASHDDGLRVLHVSKSFGKNLAVQDVSFGVRKGEVFALLGPNGAGKSTTISMIRGDIRPSNRDGEIYIENDSVIKRRAAARQHLGVCPQFDATDSMTVLEHLRFYARIRGVQDVEHNVSEVIRAVGLGLFQTRMAASLSGGNKRKLSLAIALMGNPSVLLLDEPSSGMDVAAKRVMWKTLASVVAGRSIVLTTHSMEEADALANRAAILAGRLLALGTSDYLRRKHGDRLHVHLLLKSAPYTTTEEVDRVRGWIQSVFPDATIDEKNFHGQIRFNVPAHSDNHLLEHHQPLSEKMDEAAVDDDKISSIADRKEKITVTSDVRETRQSTITNLFSTLEANKANMGYEFYSVSQTTLDQVFLSIVGKHEVEEEGYEAEHANANAGQGEKKKGWGWLTKK